MTCDARNTAAALIAVAGAVIAHRTELTRLDQEIGDGDHGENMVRGFTALAGKLDAEFGTPAEVFTAAGSTLISTVGGASGPLLGTAFLRAGAALGGAPVDAAAVAAGLAAARDGVVARGKAEPGDKTMVDALAPAAAAAAKAAADGAELADTLQAAAAAAASGADATRPWQARKGRASYLGERSIGHVDPGARSVALILATLAERARTPRPDPSDRPGQPVGPDPSAPA